MSGDPERWPLVSVIVPTRGRPDLVRATISSVIGQSYPGPIECLVVHDQEPPDPALASLGTADHQVRVIANQPHPGPGRCAQLRARRGHRGEFIATCDDDDVWHPAKLEAQIGRLLDQPDLLVVGSGIRLMLPDGRIISWPARAERISRHAWAPVTPRGGFATLPRGDVSVIPQACTSVTPRSSYALISACGTAEPPAITMRSEGQVARRARGRAAARPARSSARPAATVGRSASMSRTISAGLHVPVRHDHGRPAQHRREREPPRVDVEHRDDGEHAVPLGKSERVSEARAHRVQVDRAVAVDHALQLGRSSHCVAHRGGGLLIQLRPPERVGLGGQQFLVGVDRAARAGQQLRIRYREGRPPCR